MGMNRNDMDIEGLRKDSASIPFGVCVSLLRKAEDQWDPPSSTTIWENRHTVYFHSHKT